MINVDKHRTILSTNLMVPKNQSCLRHSLFPAFEVVTCIYSGLMWAKYEIHLCCGFFGKGLIKKRFMYESTNIRHSAFCFQGPKFFNSLNIEIQDHGTSLSLFESKLRALPLSWPPSCFLFLLFSNFYYMFVRVPAVHVVLRACVLFF